MAFQHVDEQYKLIKKQNNGIVYTIYWHMGFAFARFFGILHITPNLVSFFSLVCYGLAGYYFYFGNKWNLLGGLFFFLGILMDCTDGKLARMTNSTSRLGIWLDYNFDYLRPLFIYPPIALALFRSSQNMLYIMLAFLVLTSTLVYTIISMRWDGFDFAKQHKETYVSNSKYHIILKQFYFLEGIEPLTVIVFALINRMDIFLILWTAGMMITYLSSSFYYGFQIYKHDLTNTGN